MVLQQAHIQSAASRTFSFIFQMGQGLPVPSRNSEGIPSSSPPATPAGGEATPPGWGAPLLKGIGDPSRVSAMCAAMRSHKHVQHAAQLEERSRKACPERQGSCAPAHSPWHCTLLFAVGFSLSQSKESGS